MDHKTDIGFIDTHPKGNSSHNHLHIFVQKLILPVGPHFAIETGMVGNGFDTVGHQQIGQLGIEDRGPASFAEILARADMQHDQRTAARKSHPVRNTAGCLAPGGAHIRLADLGARAQCQRKI